MSRSLTYALFYSLLIHSLLLLYFFSIRNLDGPEPVSLPVFIEIIEPPSAQTNGRKARAGEKDLSSSLLKIQTRLTFGSESASAEDITKFGHGWNTEDFGVGGMRFENIEDYQSIERIATEADGLLYYPGALALRAYTGGVNVKLSFLKSGGCDQTGIKIDSGSLYFRVYILALIKKLCSLPQIQQTKLLRSSRVDLNFLFLLMDQAQFSPSPKFKISGNVILLERHELKPPGELRLGPIRLYGPYVAVDFAYLFEKWDELTTGRNPLEDFR